MEPKGSIPPSRVIIAGSINHFFSGIGLGTAFTLQGWLACPDIFLPSTVPTNVSGRITNRHMHAMATCKIKSGGQKSNKITHRLTINNYEHSFQSENWHLEWEKIFSFLYPTGVMFTGVFWFQHVLNNSLTYNIFSWSVMHTKV